MQPITSKIYLQQAVLNQVLQRPPYSISQENTTGMYLQSNLSKINSH